MTLVNCNPVRRMNQRNIGFVRFSDLLEDIFETSYPSNSEGLVRPRTNVTESSSNYELELSVPGYNRENIQLEIENKELIVRGNIQKNSEESISYLRHEFGRHGFERRFELPENVESEKITAKYENGILRIQLPKEAATVKKGPVTISIN